MRLLALCLTFFPILANCGEPVHPRDLADAFLSSVRAGDFSVAYDHVFAGSPMAADAPQMLTTAKAQTAAQLPLYGKILGVDFLREEPIGTSIIRLLYIMRCEKAPVVWDFVFYKPKDAWIVTGITFNTNIAALR